MSRRLRSTLPVCALCAILGLLTAPAANAQGKVPVADTQPVWASPSNLAGATRNADVRWSSRSGSAGTEQGDLDRTLADLYDPSSPSYHRWLTPRPVPRPLLAAGERRGGRPALALVGGLLDRRRPGKPPVRDGGGLGAQVEQAFGVNENMYRVDGSVLRAPNHDPVVPARRRAARERDHRPRRRHERSRTRTSTRRPPPPAGTSVGPCSSYWGQRTSTTSRTPTARARCPGSSAATRRPRSTRRTASTGCTPPASTAAGRRSRSSARSSRRRSARTSPTSRAASTSTAAMVPPPRLGRLRLPRDRRAGHASGSRSDPAETQSWYIEQALDVEWTHAVAPRAEDRLRRRRQRRPRPRPGAELRRRQPRRRRDLELAGACPRSSSRAARSWP